MCLAGAVDGSDPGQVRGGVRGEIVACDTPADDSVGSPFAFSEHPSYCSDDQENPDGETDELHAWNVVA